MRCVSSSKSFEDAGQQYRDTRSRTPTCDMCPYTNQRSCSTNGYQRIGISIPNKCTNILKTYIMKILHVFERKFESKFATISRRWPVRQRHRRVAMPSSTFVVDVAQKTEKQFTIIHLTCIFTDFVTCSTQLSVFSTLTETHTTCLCSYSAPERFFF